MTAERDADLSNGVLAAYGTLGLPLSIVGLPLFIYLPRYYAQDLGLGLTAVGAILLLARLWDGLTDPLIGLASDRLSGRFGRRKPWVAAGVPLLLVALWLLFVPPDGAGLAHLLLCSMAVYLGWTMIMLPYQSWGAELTGSFDGRTRITAAREVAIIVGTLIAGGAGQVFDGGGSATLHGLAVLTVVLLPLAAVWALWRVPDVGGAIGAGIDWRHGLALLRDNGPFCRLLAAYGLNGLANALPATLLLIFVDDYLGLSGSAGIFLVCYFAAAVVAVPLWVRISGIWGKHRTWALGLVANALFFTLVVLLEQGDFGLYLTICLLTGACLGADLVLPPSMQADVVDRDTADGGGRRTGLYFALWSLMTKLSLAVAVGVAFPLLDLAGFVPGVGEEGLWALLALYGLVPVGIKLCVAALIWRYPIDQAAHAALAERIDALSRKQAA